MIFGCDCVREGVRATQTRPPGTAVTRSGPKLQLFANLLEGLKRGQLPVYQYDAIPDRA